MPSITVELLSGRTLDQKRAFAASVTEAAIRCFGVEADGVMVRFRESSPSDVAKGGHLLVDRRIDPQPPARLSRGEHPSKEQAQ